MQDIIIEEGNIINNLLKKQNINLTNFRRDLLEKGVKKRYMCYNMMNAVSSIIIQIRSDNTINGTLSPSLSKWITDLIMIGTPSSEGIVFKGGVRFIDNIIVVKVSKNQDSSLLHEYFIGFFLNDLRKSIPNFMYVFGGFICGYPQISNFKVKNLCSNPGQTVYLISEFIKGETLREKIAQKTITKNELFSYTLQVLLSLKIAQERFQYCHYDLHDDNIIIRNIREKKNIEYKSASGNSLWMNTDGIATIIDYGLSSITYNNKRYGIKNEPRYGIDNTYKPGIDIYKFLYSTFINLINYNISSEIIREYMTIFLVYLHTYCNDKTKELLSVSVLQSQDVVKQNYMYPSAGDTLTYNATAADLISYLILYHTDIVSQYLFVKVPPKGFINLLDDCGNRSVDEILNDLTTPLMKIKPCKDYNWKVLPGHWKDKYGKERYWFDCGKYLYDGNFNIIIFPKGMSLYHGSASLTYFAGEYPLGIDYYKSGIDPLNSYQKALLKNPNTNINYKKRLLDKKQNINISYYGDYEVAVTYSKKPIQIDGSNPFVLNCGGNCISAYKLKKDINMLNLYDPFNLYILLTENYLKSDVKDILSKAYDISTVNNFVDLYEKIKPNNLDTSQDSFQKLQQAYDPFRRFLMKSQRGTLRDNDYLVPREILTIVVKLGYSGFVNPRTPYLEGSYKGQYRFAELVFGKDVLNFIERDFSNIYDWQYFDTKRLFDEIGVLVKDMYKYKTFNIDFHAGDLYEHSIWTALYIQKMFKIGSIWTEGIDSYYMSSLVIAGFLHDIGKGGDLVYTYFDKPNHSLTGFEYFKQIRKYEYRDEDGNISILNIPELLKNINIIDDNMKNLISFLILSHWEFGYYINQIKDDNINEIAQNYKNVLDQMIYTSEVILPHNLLYRMAMLISSCDIMASQVYIPTDKFTELSEEVNINPKRLINDLNAYLDDYPYLTNRPKVHRGANKYEELEIEKKGLLLRNNILAIEEEERMLV